MHRKTKEKSKEIQKKQGLDGQGDPLWNSVFRLRRAFFQRIIPWTFWAIFCAEALPEVQGDEI